MESSIKKVAELYDSRITSSNDGVLAAGQWGTKEYVPMICKEITKKISIKKTDKILELGCGSGVLGNWVSKEGGFYVGIDISYEMLRYFKNNLNDKKNDNLFNGITNYIPFNDNFFDIIIINGVTMYFDEKILLKKTLDEMVRVAKNESTLFIGENIIPSGFPYEFVWFHNLSKNKQKLAKYYIRLRKWMAKNDKLAGKWANSYNIVSPSFLKQYFKSKSEIFQSKSAAYSIKEKMQGVDYKGNKRVDFVIKLNKGKK